MKIRKLLLNALAVAALFVALPAAAQQGPTLDRCRKMALKNNKELKIAQEKVQESEALRQMAFCQFFPKVSANGTYIHNQKNLQLLSDSQQERVNNIGTTLQDNITGNIADRLAQSLNFDPVFLRRIIGRIGTTHTAEDLNAIGRDITDALNVDMTNIFAGAVSVSQPVYMGGKLRALYSTARLAGELAEMQLDKQTEDLMVAVDEAYWRVVSLQNKQQLAQQYYDLVAKLSDDVDAMMDAEVATMADVTQVRVKKNEAQMSLTKANLGLTLSRMVLNQMCGMALDSTYLLVEEIRMTSYAPENSLNMEEVYANRTELKMLEAGMGIANAEVMAARSTLLPNVGLTGSYAVSNPNLYNGFQNNFGGMFSAGVVVNIPICHPDAFYAVKAAKHKRNAVQYQMEEARDKIELQVNKFNFELQMADEKMQQARQALANAEENLRLADESFAAGLISAGDLMQAQTAWLSAKTDVADSEIELRMSYLYLQQALGRI